MSDRQIPLKMNETIELEIKDINHSGEGVGRYRDFAVFVPSTAVGDKTLTRVTEIKKSFARGELIKVIKASASRYEPQCLSYTGCGGCQIQHIDYSEQLKLKEKLVRDNISRIGGLKNVSVLSTIGMDKPWHYRNKAQLQVGWKDKRVVLGFFEEGSHRLKKKIEQCLIVDQRLNRVIAVMEELLNKYQVEPYRWGTRTGLLRHIILRIAASTGHVMVLLVTGSGDWPAQGNFCRELRASCPEVTSVIRNINTGNNRLVLGSKNKLLLGQETITDFIDGLAFDISANSFYQVNPVQTAKLYAKALEYAELSGKETLIDCYCGIGTLTLYLARYASKSVGLEVGAGAVKDAQKNAKINNMHNVEFQCGAVERIMPGLAKQKLSPEVVVLDPPRQGCKQEVLRAIADMNVHRVIYVSCNPATLARDLGILSGLGYECREIQPVDMFPQTSHVECVALMSRVEK